MLAGGRAPVLVAAGGTGGHLFPAEALAAALIQRGIPVHLATDRRAARYGGAFVDESVHVIASATLRARNPVALAQTATTLATGFMQAWSLIGRLKPAAVIGFGGYPTLPPVLAAAWRGVPTVIHDANAVIGRANRLLAPRVTAIATTFPDMFRDRPRLAAKATLTGNPVRPAVVAAAATPYPPMTDRLWLLVFGGSQGARVMADVVPAAIEALDPALRARLMIVQQAREEDLARVRDAYAVCRSMPKPHLSFPICRRALRQAIWLWRARALPPSPNWPPSAGLRSWCRCRTRSTRINSPMPAFWPASTQQFGCRRPSLRHGGSRPKSPRLQARPNGSPPWRRRRNFSAGSMPPTGWRTWF